MSFSLLIAPFLVGQGCVCSAKDMRPSKLSR
jgi:hypothetical protein